MWHGGFHRMYRDSDWGKQRRKARERDNNTCQCCGKKGDKVGLPVHHLIPYRLSKSNKLINLITLCDICHAKSEWNFRFMEEQCGDILNHLNDIHISVLKNQVWYDIIVDGRVLV